MGKQESLKMLDEGQFPEKYQRNRGTIGVDGQRRLLNAKVAVVGAGGLGGHIIELLTRQGIGYLKIIDGDFFKPHNLNRQLLATELNLGCNKAVAAAKRIKEVNSDVQADAVPQMLDESNAVQLLLGLDVIVDALDSIQTRLLLNAVAQKLAIPLVHGAIAGFTGQVATVLPGKPGLENLYHGVNDKGIETLLGNPAATPALAAALQAQEVVKIITGIGNLLSESWLYFDTEVNVFELLKMG